MPRRIHSVRAALLGLSLLTACASRQPSAEGAKQCTAKDGSKYGPSSLPEVQARLERDSAQVRWEDVPEPYRPWAAEHLKRKLGRAAATLADSSNCREVEAAATKIKPLAKRIADAAKKCTDPQCLGAHPEPTQLDSELELALCPLYPFC
ncbi:MAG: hypothetical protein EOO73_08445 [Myxococcales bacterium]|nr:MAG: hypothetical protein EOO73_08445 [Myxococcales bacterium]